MLLIEMKHIGKIDAVGTVRVFACSLLANRPLPLIARGDLNRTTPQDNL